MTSRLGLTPESNVWVGAWWLGFLGASIFGLLIFLPIAALPKSLPGNLSLAYF
jgi:organic anion transporter 4A